MLWKRSPKPTSPRLEKLNEDVLFCVVEQISAIDDLINVCRVSRQLHALATLLLYRNVNLILSRFASHRRLIHRLAKPDSHSQEHIRVLQVWGIKDGCLQSVFDLGLTLQKMPNLREFYCLGPLSFPDCVLDFMIRRATGINQNSMASSIQPRVLQPLHSALNREQDGCLTSFKFQFESNHQTYDAFKSDIVRLLSYNRTLRSLMIWAGASCAQKFPDMLRTVPHWKLPKLKNLVLFTGAELKIFTASELRHWGTKGGWGQLTELSPSFTNDLFVFMGETPRLKHLHFRSHKISDLDTIEEYMAIQELIDPLGQGLEYLHWHADVIYSPPPNERRLVPWCLLEHAKQLKTLILYHVRFDGWVPGAEIDTMRAAEILRLQTLCPDLEELKLDVVCTRGLPILPTDMIQALSQFRKPTKLFLYLHDHSPRISRLWIDRWDFRALVNDVIQERKRKHLLCVAPFEISFKLIREWSKMESRYTLPDYRFWVNEQAK
jgi:hypothetical protein